MREEKTLNREGSGNNEIYFNAATISEASKTIPEFINKYWKVELENPTSGCIRTLDDHIIAIYFYIKTTIHSNVVVHVNGRISEMTTISIMRFNYKNGKLEFDSIYVRSSKDKDSSFDNKKEYRYDKDNNLIAAYNFHSKSSKLFCTQTKNTKNTKNYTRFKESQVASEILKEASKKYLTKEITNELVPAFHTEGNKKEIYWLIE